MSCVPERRLPPASQPSVVSKILRGEYSNPVRVVAFNTAEGWSRDVTEDIARAVVELAECEGDADKVAREFTERVLGQEVWTL